MNVGVTGGFSSGKSTFAFLLSKKLKYHFFSCDDFIKGLYKKKTLRKIMIDKFGHQLYKRGILQKRLLSELVFNSEESLRKLESIIHPIVESEIKKRVTSVPANTVFEIPLLYEKNYQTLMDLCVLVVCNREKQLERALNRGFSKKEFNRRIRFQLSDRDKIKREPVVVMNNDSIHDLKQEVLRVTNLILPIKKSSRVQRTKGK
ncbi:MAG: dephospho-CoA kinase [Candidatus Aureabacteria bacterium]|nr:dephospho-CoA kinase [Candidatus Auribacterota bacterium]